MSELIKWRCPKCNHTIRAIASEVTHRCPSNKNLYTAFVSEPTNKD